MMEKKRGGKGEGCKGKGLMTYMILFSSDGPQILRPVFDTTPTLELLKASSNSKPSASYIKGSFLRT